ncbi:DUF4178 domain-containing protein [Fulvivirga maritima]|uniref:DUF4178 domain-containing protein n=1 Tax=Fulvivirga maritima TaxID=2904247 RepID=UPI001F1E9657|nr:DUF4178 domain-containing protein [Fulvivirga maritima]UII26954.1 DUF4178 domain-containing protein [Fulvivirga maritima]
MGLFDNFFKKKEKEPHYDSTDIRVQDLDVGFVFDYDLSTWEVNNIYEYDWGDNYFTREYKISNGEKSLFLSLEEDDELELSVSSKIKVRALGSEVVDKLMTEQKPPSEITYDGRTYYLEEESPGYFHDIGRSDDWEEFVSWDYEDDKGEYILTVEQWGEKEFEASAGKYIKEFEISNILPSGDT